MKSKAVGTVLLGLYLCAGYCEAPPELNPGPVQAELMAPLSVRRLVTGAKVLARTTLEWKGQDCTLRNGAILEATVETANRRQDGSVSHLALSFNKAQCNGLDLKPINLLLAAVAQAPADWNNVPDSVFKMPVTLLMSNGNTASGGSGIGGFSLSHMELRGIVHRFPMSAKIKSGDVIEIKGMKLEVGTGPNHSSVISTKNRDVTLDIYTQFLLVPTSLVMRPGFMKITSPSPAEAAGAPSAASPASPHPGPPPPPPVNDLEVCAPPGCAVDLPVTAHELEGHDAASIAVHPLGYVPRPRKVLDDFGNEETLAWLSPRQLLFAFNPHPLIRRVGTRNSNTLRRVIRAVLLDAAGRNVLRAVDWEITDTQRYLWSIDGNRILVHVGNELRVYGENLEFQRSIPLAGPLYFVRLAPNGNLMAIATLRERHSQELHARLRDDLGSEPEEDVDVAILDKDFKAIANASTVSGLMPPTLLNEGQVTLLSQPNMHYRLALSTWDNKTATLARFTSRCTPELSSVAPDHLFLLTCDVATGATVYRVIGANGKVMLRREAGRREVGQELIGKHGTGLFAIKVVHALSELVPGNQFKVTELDSEEVMVYRAADGKRLFAVSVGEPAASFGSYAMSPDGAQLAVFSQSQIQLFPVPSPKSP